MQNFNDYENNINNFNLLSSKRLQNEIKTIYDYINYRTNNKVNITDFCIGRDNLTFDIINKNKIHFSFLYNDKCMVSCTLIFKTTYPFKPPSVYLNNGKDYISLLTNLNQHFNNFKTHVGDNPTCFCCSTLTCSHNWGPQNMITDVISEYHKIFAMIDKHIEKMLIKNIYEKYLGYDIG